MQEFDRHNLRSGFQTDSHSDNIDAHKGEGIESGTVKLFSRVISDPDTKYAVSANLSLLPTVSDWSPDGITLRKVGIKVFPAAAYTVEFQEWKSVKDLSPTTIDTLTTSVTTPEVEVDPPAVKDIPAGSIVRIVLPATDIDELIVWFTYTIDG